MSIRKVVIIQRVLPHYRLVFFDKLSDALKKQGVELTVVYGDEYPGDVPKTADCDSQWAKKIKNRYIRLGRIKVVWQPCLSYIKKADLVIVEQANSLLVNYLLLFIYRSKLTKIAYWGHGKNMQGETTSFRETIKKRLSTCVDWWFAYTELSCKTIVDSGFEKEKITVVNNAIDNTQLIECADNINEIDNDKLRRDLGVCSDNVAIYCGGIYSDKKIEFLINSCVQIRKLVPDFHVIILGDGPLADLVSIESEKYDWFHYVGAKFGKKRVPYFLISKLLLMPGLVGLAVVDSFVLKTPMFTTDIPIHSPEISYLINDKNGIMTDHSVDEYSKSVVSYLNDKDMQNRLIQGCIEQSKEITLDNMVGRFEKGVVGALDA